MQNKAIITGAGGQLGQELIRTAPGDLECLQLYRADLDIGDERAVRACLAQHKPHLVINAAAYTAVDLAESEPEQAQRINARGPANLATACKEAGTRLLHVSTDFVFDGESSTPYTPQTPTAPLGEYGRSKLAGEQAVQSILPAALIMRTGWVYSSFGSNFVKTMLQLMSEREELSVVADQRGTPTWANGLAKALWSAAAKEQLSGVYHWSDEGECSWYDFALAIAQEGLESGLLQRTVKIKPIPATQYPTPAQRPTYSVLDKTESWRDLELQGVHWRTQLQNMLRDFKELENV